MSQWINFKELRRKLDFRRVLESYGIKITTKTTQHLGFCPLPHHPSGKREATFSAELEKGIWQCFGCKAKGNVIEFAAHMEKLDPQKPVEFRQAALKLQERFFPKAEPPKAKLPERTPSSEAVFNAPLDFELKRLDATHPALRELQLTADSIDTFGLGFCSHGTFKERIAIPLHNRDGQLVGYAGLSHDEYLFPAKRERQRVTYDFDPSLLLYGAERMTRPVEILYVVEDCRSLWWLWQAGFKDVVALLGNTLSLAQMDILKSLVLPAGRVVTLASNDQPARLIVPHRFVRWLKPVKSLWYLKPVELKSLLR